MSTILIVDDESSVRDFLTILLEEEGYRVTTARNGQEGLACLRETPPDLVLCDIMMPILDGVGFCRAVQKDPATRAIPIVLMTAVPKPLTPENTGCTYAGLLTKPFNLDTIVTLVEQLLDGAGGRVASGNRG
jgi:CheY-like chemotaxis protein